MPSLGGRPPQLILGVECRGRAEIGRPGLIDRGDLGNSCRSAVPGRLDRRVAQHARSGDLCVSDGSQVMEFSQLRAVRAGLPRGAHCQAVTIVGLARVVPRIDVANRRLPGHVGTHADPWGIRSEQLPETARIDIGNAEYVSARHAVIVHSRADIHRRAARGITERGVGCSRGELRGPERHLVFGRVEIMLRRRSDDRGRPRFVAGHQFPVEFASGSGACDVVVDVGDRLLGGPVRLDGRVGDLQFRRSRGLGRLASRFGCCLRGTVLSIERTRVCNPGQIRRVLGNKIPGRDGRHGIFMGVTRDSRLFAPLFAEQSQLTLKTRQTAAQQADGLSGRLGLIAAQSRFVNAAGRGR